MGQEKRLLDELVAIKKLLIMRLINDGIDAATIGVGLGLTGQRVGQLVPVKRIRKVRTARERELER